MVPIIGSSGWQLKLAQIRLLCHLKTRPFAGRVFRRRFPWLGKELTSPPVFSSGLSESFPAL
jgi:hypothetical protein